MISYKLKLLIRTVQLNACRQHAPNAQSQTQMESNHEIGYDDDIEANHSRQKALALRSMDLIGKAFAKKKNERAIGHWHCNHPSCLTECALTLDINIREELENAKETVKELRSDTS